jgi:hypothetical protein
MEYVFNVIGGLSRNGTFQTDCPIMLLQLKSEATLKQVRWQIARWRGYVRKRRGWNSDGMPA